MITINDTKRNARMANNMAGLANSIRAVDKFTRDELERQAVKSIRVDSLKSRQQFEQECRDLFYHTACILDVLDDMALSIEDKAYQLQTFVEDTESSFKQANKLG